MYDDYMPEEPAAVITAAEILNHPIIPDSVERPRDFAPFSTLDLGVSVDMDRLNALRAFIKMCREMIDNPKFRELMNKYNTLNNSTRAWLYARDSLTNLRIELDIVEAKIKIVENADFEKIDRYLMVYGNASSAYSGLMSLYHEDSSAGTFARELKNTSDSIEANAEFLGGRTVKEFYDEICKEIENNKGDDIFEVSRREKILITQRNRLKFIRAHYAILSGCALDQIMKTFKTISIVDQPYSRNVLSSENLKEIEHALAATMEDIIG